MTGPLGAAEEATSRAERHTKDCKKHWLAGENIFLSPPFLPYLPFNHTHIHIKEYLVSCECFLEVGGSKVQVGEVLRSGEVE